jgi:hypothetical protein
MIFNCPACAAQVKFQSSASVFGICSYCQSTLVRHDKNIESLGKMAQLPPDMSPVQIGSGGKWMKVNFMIIGQKKMSWEHGLWNEWFIMFDDARTGWLGEAQGHWAISFGDTSIIAPAAKDLLVGQSYKLGKKTYLLDDFKDASCSGSLGELPAQALKGDKFTSADFTGDNLSFASVDYSSSIPIAYLGSYVEFEDFKFSNLRQIDGW